MTKALTPIDDFKLQIHSAQVQDNLRGFLPKGKDGDALMEKFTAVTIRAVQENPDLLQKAERKSLFLACQRATQDGLMPDNREGALVLYGKNVQWQPMIQGIRKKLAQAGFDIRAEIVYKKDEFVYELGDNPGITHRPPSFGDRGPIIGAYAIATERETGDKWREIMDVDELEKVRLSSRGKDSPAWKVWKTEMYRKTVAKRLRKYLPISDDSVLDLIDRDNEQFSMDIPVQTSQTAKDVQEAVRSAATEEPIEGELVEPEVEKPKKAKKKKTATRKARTPEEIEQDKEADDAPEPDPFDF